QALLDESFRDSLRYLVNEAAGAEIRLVELRVHLDSQREVVEQLKTQVVSLQRAVTDRYSAIQRILKERADDARSEEEESFITKGIELFAGDDVSPGASRLREAAARMHGS